MKITRVNLYVVNVPERRWWWSDDVYGQPEHQTRDHYLVEAETDEGLTGLSELHSDVPLLEIKTSIGVWSGKDVLKVNHPDTKVPFPGYFEQIILDLRGQALGVPIWQLLGGRLRDRIFVTQCTGYKTPEHTAQDVLWGWEQGFRAYKMKCITQDEDTPEKRIRYVTDRVEAIHNATPEMIVRPDVRWRLREIRVAQELANRLEGYRIDCLESPIPRPSKGGSYSEMCRLRESIRIPIGDHLRGEDLIAVFQAQALDYAILGAESPFEAVGWSRLAHQLGLGGWSQTVAYGPGVAISLHVAACMPHMTQPHDMIGPLAWEDMLVKEPFILEDGCYLVPDRPGLGYSLNQKAVGKYLVEKQSFE